MSYSKLAPGTPGNPEPFGKYRLMGLVARGGMAEVYRARIATPEEHEPDIVAIKVMRPELAKEKRFVSMFHREGKLAKMLTDDTIVRTFEYGEIEGRHYIAMDYIGGRDLTQVLRRCQKTDTRIPVPHAIFMGAVVARALSFAHLLKDENEQAMNIVNRDVSPSNVRVAYTGDVKVFDFGIAQDSAKFTSEIGVLKGKFSYMSPEQIRGMPVDARTDIFSTGIILHEMLTTEKLFRGDTEFALMEKVRKAEIPPPSRLNKRVNEKLDAIVLKALARNVDERYQSSKELADDLSELLEVYKFDKRELRDFMRKLFRDEWKREQALQKQLMAPLTIAEEDEYEVVVDSAPGHTPDGAGDRKKRFSVPVPDQFRAKDSDDTGSQVKNKPSLWSRLMGRKK